MPALRLAVLLTVHDQRPFLGPAIASILAQTLREFDFIIVDDASTDGAREVIEAAARSDSRIRPLFLPQNLGLGGALQAGLALTDADLVARMDGDDIAMPDRLRLQLAAMEGGRLDVLGTAYTRLGARHWWQTGTRRPMRGHENIVRNLPYANELCHPSVMFRKSVIDAAGGYDPRFVFAQDYDLWLRLIGRARFDNLPQGLLQMRRHAARSSGPQNRERHTRFSVTAAANHFLRRSGAEPLDPRGSPLALAEALVRLLGTWAGETEAHRALVRHATRLVRNCPLPPVARADLRAAVLAGADWRAQARWRLYRLG